MGKRRKIPLVQPDPVKTLHGSFPVDTLDLHGCNADEGERRVRDFIEGWRRREPGVILRIITGKGLRSEGPPVLIGRVRELLVGPLSSVVADYVVEMGGGSYLVRLR